MKINSINNFFCFTLFFIFITISNYFDWDHFLSFTEVELRSYLIDFEFPFWTYQLCGGVTRIGDPQSFGLSPLFLLNILLGSFWGLKLLIFTSAIIGFTYLKKIGGFFTQDSTSVNSICLFFIFSNYFVWHFHHGHITFILHYWFIPISYHYIKFLIGAFEKNDFWRLLGFIIVFFSSGFYHSLVFFAFPFVLSYLLSMPFWVFKVKSRNAVKFILCQVLGFILVSWKLFFVLNYQNEFTRVVNQNGESNSFFNILTSLFIPTWNYNFAFGITTDLRWGIWEYSAFSFANIIFILLILKYIFTRAEKLQSFKLSNINKFLIIYFFITIALYVGNILPNSPFELINQIFFKNSVRVVGRFGINIIFILSLSCFVMLKHLKNHFITKKIIVGITIPCIIFTLSSINSIDADNVLKIFNLNFSNTKKMFVVDNARQRNNYMSYMYPLILQGRGVLNCYQPINREIRFQGEQGLRFLKTQNFIFAEDGSISQDCINNSYYTQNSIFISPSCSTRVCLLMNHLTNEDRKNFSINSKNNLYCNK